jgi:hypothetical protein
MQPDDAGVGAVGSVLTPDVLEEFWPEAKQRLLGALRSQGISEAVAEDAVSEAVTRALSRGLPVHDVDDFCRWAFIVARNVALDSLRGAQRLTSVAVLPDGPDHYDLVSHVEVRERWRETVDAISSLTELDRVTLLATLGEEPVPVSRRDAIRDAVRRHRARARLRSAMAHVGAWLGWVKRPRHSWTQWAAAYDRPASALLVPLLATLSALLPAANGTRAEVRPVEPRVASGVTGQPQAAAAAGPAQTAPTAAPRQIAARPALAAGPAADTAATRGVAFEFASSPAYDSDHTVFAAASERSDSCNSANGVCPLLYRSTDGGVSWTLLPAQGRGIGRILLPPAYPNDPRIFSAGLTLSVSADGGHTFTTVAPASGPASMSPLFSDGDPRILFGSDRALLVPQPMQYLDGMAGTIPLRVPLPQSAIPLQFWFPHDRDFAADRRMLVAAVEAPRPTGDLVAQATRLVVNSSTIYSCTDQACDLVVDLGAENMPKRAWTGRDTVFVGGSRALHRSVDGGRSFVPVTLPGTEARRLLVALTASAGKLFATISSDQANQLFVSEDDAGTWRLLDEKERSFYNMIALPDGALLDGVQSAHGGITCSVDGGITWADTCARPAPPTP